MTDLIPPPAESARTDAPSTPSRRELARSGPGPGSAPGLALAGAAAAVALGVHAWLPTVTASLVAVLLGLGVAATGAVPAATAPGLAVASRRVLRVGVALLGLQLVLDDVLALGWPTLLGVVLVVVGGILGSLRLARWLGVPADTALLVACGFSICGAAAVAAVHGVRRGSAEAVATALALVVAAGTATMLVLPLLAVALGMSPVAAGAWSGASVHEVGQVVVAGGVLGAAALQVAVVVKLARVLMLAPVLAVLSWQDRRGATGGIGGTPLVPGFVVAFLACVALRSAVPLPAGALEVAGWVQSAALAAAMFALGAGLRPEVLRSLRGPLLVLALTATGWVVLLGLPVALLAG